VWTVVSTLVFLAVFGVPSILAHCAALHPELKFYRKTAYVIYSLYAIAVAAAGVVSLLDSSLGVWFSLVTIGFPVFAMLCLLRPTRLAVSAILTPLNLLASFDFLSKWRQKNAPSDGSDFINSARGFSDAKMLNQIFLPDSLPHLNGLILYLFSLGISMQRLKLSGFEAPTLASAPEARQIDIPIIADFLSTLLVVACGVGIFISRRPREVLFRLSVVKPGRKEFLLGTALCFFTFFYDYVWSLFTHDASGGGALATVMKNFNVGSYSGSGDAATAFFLAAGIGIIAGVEEEITTRGALQPALGILPAAFLHAALHTQFNAAPLFILQVFGWSALMGVAKYYTNTTTTIIAHGLFNFISCFFIAFNPP
jgi:hypothetical protein